MSPQFRPVLIVLLLLSVCAAVYGPVCRHPFVRFDDEINVYRNPYLNPVTGPNLGHFWVSSDMGETCRVYRPVVYSLYALIAWNAEVRPYLSDGQGAALDPRPFHEVNLVVHLLNVLLVFVLIRKFVRNDWAAALGALVFAVHPVQVEPVAWVTGLTDLLGAFFSLLALWEYGRFRDAGRRRHYALATLCFALALLSKPSAAVLPLLALVLESGLPSRAGRKSFQWESLQWLAPWAVLSAGIAVVTHFAEPVAAASVVTAWWDRPLLAADALTVSLGHLFWPAHLGVDYGRSPDVVLGGGWLLWRNVFAVAGLAALLWRGRRRFPWLFSPAAFFVLALLPVLGFVPFRFQTFSTVADRYLYLALFGPALLVAEMVSRTPLPGRRFAAAGACAGILALGLLASRQTATWRSTNALWAQALSVNPASWLARYDLGGLLEAQGKPEQAHVQFQELVRLKPDYRRMNLP